ncbi:mitochondrial escape protein 2 [Neophaeococcomyces mojaviensis]|uniref:Mitochondrial escape protein 2 n=1 Tax=Neophaeococcomyces mojaviensis TaxID=3383035 RepID=A0ACC3AGF3_9EURO|nr:mitochondrial escape protein 2 [Knufia sp. JES_112]
MLSNTGLLRRPPRPLTAFQRQCLHSFRNPRPRPAVLTASNRGRRHTSSDSGEDETGHINTASNEGILFFDNLFPLKLAWLTRLPYIDAGTIVSAYKKGRSPGIALSDPTDMIRRALPDNLPITIQAVLPRVREGGAYVKFSHDGGITTEELEGTVKAYLKGQPIKPWFNPFRRVRAFLVKGKPWIEDLYRLPSTRVKVEFLPTSPEASAAELTQETLYSLFRRYGTILEMISQPSDSKITPRYAYIDYSRMRFSTMAKNCMHGFVLVAEQGGGKTGTLLKIQYEPKAKTRWIRDWIASHPRIVLPIVAALIAAASVAVFDPIRTWMIRLHITHELHLDQNQYYLWLRRQLTRGYDYLRFKPKRNEDTSLNVIWEDRHTQMEQLQTWMSESVDTFIVVQGPRGAGKKQLVEQALEDKQYRLTIDCKRIQEARGDTKTINAAAAEVGYRPVFSWLNSWSSMIDLAAMGTIGTKTGLSETVENQLVKIWTNTSSALRSIALTQRQKEDRDANLGDDEWLEAHPEARPVVIIDNFLHKTIEGNTDMVYDKLAEWGAHLTTRNIAHVIFLTTDVSFSKSLSKALPDRAFRQIALGDCSPEVAKKVVLHHLNADAVTPEGEQKITPSQLRSDLDELDSVIQVLGGRLTDLEFLARRIQAGESPGSAVKQIIEQSASEILKMYLLDTDRSWSPQQAWVLIRELAANEELKYNELLLDDMFSKNGEQVLQNLEQAELITISSANGRPNKIKPGKPVYLSAFQYLSEDDVLRSRLDLSIMSQLAAKENTTIQSCEEELQRLAQLPGTPAEVKPRIKYLLAKAAASQDKIVKFEAKMGQLKKTLAEKY